MWIDLDLVGIPVLWICENRSEVAGMVHSKKGRQLSPEDVYVFVGKNRRTKYSTE